VFNSDSSDASGSKSDRPRRRLSLAAAVAGSATLLLRELVG
jgi:hypothetical protein